MVRSTDKLWVFNIERFAIHDGPGIRTTVFLQGCPLSCRWCANPESQKCGRHLMHLVQKCTGCGRCIKSCGENAISLADGKAVIDREKCTDCGRCADACLNGVNQVSGREMEAEEIYDLIMRDKQYYMTSGGGVTFSGGEALLYIDKLKNLILKLRAKNINVSFETCGNVPTENIRAALPLTDLFLYDMKSMNAAVLKKYTDGELSLILKNLSAIAAAAPERIVLRIPVIPAVNCSHDDIEAVFKCADKLGIGRIDLLPYHTLGVTKYRQLGIDYTFGIMNGLRADLLKPFLALGKRYGLDVRIEG